MPKNHNHEIRVAWRQYRSLIRRAARYSTWSNHSWVSDVLSSAEKIKGHALELERLDAEQLL